MNCELCNKRVRVKRLWYGFLSWICSDHVGVEE